MSGRGKMSLVEGSNQSAGEPVGGVQRLVVDEASTDLPPLVVAGGAFRSASVARGEGECAG